MIDVQAAVLAGSGSYDLLRNGVCVVVAPWLEDYLVLHMLEACYALLFVRAMFGMEARTLYASSE